MHYQRGLVDARKRSQVLVVNTGVKVLIRFF
jgi:hypothetical protein